MESKNKTLEQFIIESASDAPFPGGGGVSALVASLATSLGNMVGSLTLGKKKYIDVQDEIVRLNNECKFLEESFLKMIDEDAENFEPLSKAYKLDKESENYDKIMQEALILACRTPIKIVECGQQTANIIERYATIGSRLALSDAGCAAILLQAAIKAASLNVYINTKYMKDRNKAQEINNHIKQLTNECTDKCLNIYQEIEKTLKGE